jgi:hypothetical protein
MPVGVARSPTADCRTDRLSGQNPLPRLFLRALLRAVILAFKLIGPLVQLVTEIFQHVGNPFVPRLFGQAIAFFGLGANLVGKISHRLVTPPRGACFAVAGKNRCPIPKRKPKN